MGSSINSPAKRACKSNAPLITAAGCIVDVVDTVAMVVVTGKLVIVDVAAVVDVKVVVEVAVTVMLGAKVGVTVVVTSLSSVPPLVHFASGNATSVKLRSKAAPPKWHAPTDVAGISMVVVATGPQGASQD